MLTLLVKESTSSALWGVSVDKTSSLLRDLGEFTNLLLHWLQLLMHTGVPRVA